MDSNQSNSITNSNESMQISMNSSNELIKTIDKTLDELDETINQENLLSSTKMPSPPSKKPI